jgi:hypothetical protein
MQPRPWRAPTGIVVDVEEQGVPVGHGYTFSILGPHDADVGHLLAQLRDHAEGEVARRYLEPNPARTGWLVSGEAVAGRLVWNEGRQDGDPYDVVVDGRTLSWDDLGRALEPFEGWRFRLVIEDPSLDARPDAEVVAFPAASAPEATIHDVLTEFLAVQEQRLAPRTFANYLTVVELLRDCLNGYGHQYLDEGETPRFEQAFDAGREDAFVHLFGPEKIAAALGEFLDYFMIRKVMAGEELLRAAGTVTKKLAKWMAANGYLDDATAGDAVERAASAARDLPKAERLSRLLYEQAERDAKSHQFGAGDEVVEDYFTIVRVEPGALWLSGDVGPVNVDTAASSLARPGWSVNLVLARSARGWDILEVGNVYP